MTSGDPPSGVVDSPERPYVGMRAFQKNEQAIFFGRKRDASLLRDKVFSARLTVVYGPSGVGKSSILHTLLIPYLEEEDARVIYFDNWIGADPLKTLKAELLVEAEKLKIPDPGAGAPNLSDLILLLKSADARTFVLILDQFEEFFTHGNNPDILRKELGALVRASELDVRVLLSLREEHLAALEPFRMEILTLFQSTYRLEPLRDEGVQQAIEGPAKLFGVEFQPGLVTDLINDLRHEDNVTRWDPVTGMAVDLPMLQLICSELWKEMIRSGQKTITKSLYRNRGGQAGILKDYLRQVMPNSWKEKIITAKLMRYLAPSDGHKIPYSAETLVELEDLDRNQVERELVRLSAPEVRVLRDRSSEDNVFFELYHDRFISFICPWRDQVLQEDKRRRLLAFGSKIFFSILLLTGIFIFGFSEIRLREYNKYTDEQMKKLNPPMVDSDKKEIFEKVADYLLNRKEDTIDYVGVYLGRTEDSFDKLKHLFLQYAPLMPPDYGIEHKELEAWQKQRKEKLLTLRYSPARKLDEKSFRETWNNLSLELTKSLGILVPIILNYEKGLDQEFGEKTVSLVGEGIETLNIEIPIYEEQAVIEPDDLSETGRKFRERFEKDWTQIDRWLIVPRWSIPAWKSLNANPIGGSNITAFRLAEALKKHPDRLLTVEAVDTMLDKVTENSPLTVAEAKAVRQGKIRQDLQEIVKQGISLTKLPLILEALALYPEKSSSEIASKVITDLNSPQMITSYRLSGPHPKQQVETKGSDLEQEKCKKFPWYYKKSDNELQIRNLEKLQFITADKVNKELSNLKPAVRSWLEKNYSLTDLKLLLRAVVNPAEDVLVSNKEEPMENAEGRTNQPSPENSINQPAWLLASLVFWSQTGDRNSFPALAEDLRRTQDARLIRKQTITDNPQSEQIIKAGIKALHHGCISEAEAAFGQALKADKEAAVSNFLASYSGEI
jgi:Novel STAND NTPase 1/FHIPEP family